MAEEQTAKSAEQPAEQEQKVDAVILEAEVEILEEGVAEQDTSEPELSLDVIKLPAKRDEVTSPTGPLPSPKRVKGTGKKIDDSEVRYEVVRMLLDGMSYAEISEVLRTLYHYRATELTLAAFKQNFFGWYKDFIDRVDKARHAHLVARITEEMKKAAQGAVHEVFELQSLLVILDECIERIREMPLVKRSASYEGYLKDYILAKVRILERMTKITGSSGYEEKLKDMVRLTALAAQKTVIQYIQEEHQEKAFALFETELRALLESIESGFETTSPAKTK